jgi:hypothetical protein
MKKLLVAVASMGTLAGCVMVQPLPSERLTRLDATMQQAASLGANGVPSARMHLKLAHDQGLAAKQLAMDGDDRANLVLARAQSDALLAVALAHEAQVHRSMEREDSVLQSESQRSTP